MTKDAEPWPGLFVREGDRIIPALPEDEEVARGYREFPGKGRVARGYRITILTRSLTYEVGDVVRVIHVCEAVDVGTRLYVMGPKPVYGESVDGMIATEAPPPGVDPLAPSPYDGRAIEGPGVDFNYDITRYRFDTLGRHSIQWRLDELASNDLVLQITQERH